MQFKKNFTSLKKISKIITINSSDKSIFSGTNMLPTWYIDKINIPNPNLFTAALILQEEKNMHEH